MPSSPANSLFASDYSLSTPASPVSPRASVATNSASLAPRAPPSPSPLRQKPLDVSFPASKDQLAVSTALPTPPISPMGSGSPDDVSPVEDGDESRDMFAASPTPLRVAKKASVAFSEESEQSHASQFAYRRESEVSKTSRRSSKQVMETYEGCMEAGLGHETKANTYKVGTEKAYKHLNRAIEYFNAALTHKPNNARGLLARAKVLIQLSTNYQPPRVATASLTDAVKSLRTLVEIAPKSVSARETLAQAAALLSSIYLENEDAADDDKKIWEGRIGSLAREALAYLEDVAADKMDRIRAMRKDDAAQQAPAMAETFLALSSAAITVSSLAVDVPTVDAHCELAEQALDQASNMATVAAAARVKSSSSSANLITRVQLASGRSSLERLRHTFLLGAELDEDDFRLLMADMAVLATECRERAAKLKGSKGAAASTLAWEAVRQVGDAKVLYASLLRLVWRKRRPASKVRASASGATRKPSSRADSMEATIKEEDEDEKAGNDDPNNLIELSSKSSASRKSISSNNSRGSVSGGEEEFVGVVPTLGKNDVRKDSQHSTGSRKDSHPPGISTTRGKEPLSPIDARRNLSTDTRRDSAKSGSRKGSALDAMPEEEELSSFSPSPNTARFSINQPSTMPAPSGRRGSWLADGGHSSGTMQGTSPARHRRLSSMSTPLTGPDGISAWSRKASVISLADEEAASGLVSSSDLAQTAYELLDSAVKQYKLALTLLSSSDLPTANLARAKTDTLLSIAYTALFLAGLSRRVPEAKEKRTGLLVTAEVYSTWGAREVGWSFLIEGTKEALSADRRTNSWRADESGKRAVMLLLRTWWHRAVTTEAVDVDTKVAARDAVEVVVRRMRDREGVREGDVARFRGWLVKQEGEFDPAEALFWRSVSRILRGGAGFVMS